MKRNAGSRGRHVFYAIAFGIASFVVAILLIGELADVEFDFFVFEQLSLAALDSPWDSIAEYVLATCFGLSMTFAYLHVERKFRPSMVLQIPLTLVFGIVGFLLLLAGLGIAIAALATALLIFALLFGRGDR